MSLTQFKQNCDKFNQNIYTTVALNLTTKNVRFLFLSQG